MEGNGARKNSGLFYGGVDIIKNKHQENVKELQNKTQPLPRTLIEIAQAEAANLSTGTSILGRRNASQCSGVLSNSCVTTALN